MKTKDIYHFLEMIDKDDVRDQIVPCFMGCPGIGKTHEIERYAKDRDKKVVHIIASQILPSEVSGITMPDKEAGGMTVYDHVRLSSLKDGDILFFDELLQGQQQVLSACLTLIQERRLMSDRPLPDVMIVAAANPLANPNQLPAAIRDRFLFIGMEFDFDEWKQYMKDSQDIIIEDSMQNEIDASDTNVTGWNAQTPRTVTKLCKFITNNIDDEDLERFLLDAHISSRLVKSLIMSTKGASASSMSKFTEKVEAVIKGISDTEDEHTDVLSEINRLASGKTSDTTTLMNMLMNMDEWDDVIKPMLESMKL
ncbi:MAG: DnaA protein [Bacteriophage sp.]|nr:MAG: DnaA protein [Bacteriophage sp.]